MPGFVVDGVGACDGGALTRRAVVRPRVRIQVRMRARSGHYRSNWSAHAKSDFCAGDFAP